LPANVCTQYFETGNVSFRAQGAVVGKTFLMVAAAPTGGPGLSTDPENLFVLKTCLAGQKAVGVCKYDVANGEAGGVHGQPGMIVPVTAGAAGVNAGVEVESNATGQAIPFSAGIKLGICMSAGASGFDAAIKLY
jgi:hypothetical protein